jgi:hypothetical protein
MCVGREREKAAIGEFITGVASASHGLALIGRSTEVRGRRVQSMTCYHARGPGVSSGGVSCCRRPPTTVRRLVMAWDVDQLGRIAGSEELRITTSRPDGTQRRWTPIWVVRVGDAVYIRSAGGRGSDWYRHATLHNSGRIRAHGFETDVALQPVDDPALVAQVTEAYRAKYASQPSLVAMFLRPPGTEATLRVDQPQ